MDALIKDHYWPLSLGLVALMFGMFAAMAYLQHDAANEELSLTLINPICLVGSLMFALEARAGQLKGTLYTFEIISKRHNTFWFNFAVGVTYTASAVFVALAIFI